MARKALTDGLVRFDEAQGYRGPVAKIDHVGDWGARLADVKALNDIAPWRLAVVLQVGDQAAQIGLQPVREPGGALSKERQTGTVPLEGVKWARPSAGNERFKAISKVTQVLSPGDVVYVEPLNKDQNTFRLRQVPEVSGAMVVMDPWTGRVLAMVGGFSYDQSQFNRATQALRQPGSSFKPFVYAAALDNGYTPSTVVMDAPIEVDTGPGGTWSPENYSKQVLGPQTLRFGIEQSRNVMTVRLAQDIGMPLIGEYAKRFGVYDELPNYLSYALGAGETTVMRMVTAYSMFANGGRRIKPTLIDRIQDRYGHTIYKHDQRECRGCDADKWANQPEPTLVDKREQVLDADDRLPDHLDDGRRGPARHRDRGQGSRQADRRQDRHHQRREGRLVHRLLARSRGRRLYRLRQAAPPRPRRDRRPPGGADRAGLPQGGARRQAGGAVPRAARHQAHPHRPQDRPARRPRRRAADPRGVQARHRAARLAPRSSGSARTCRRTPERSRPTPTGAIRSGTGGLY